MALMIEALSQGLSGHGRRDAPSQWGGNVFLQVVDPELFAGREAFLQQMDFLVEKEYRTITPDQFMAWKNQNRPLPLRPVLLTVDDNYILVYTSMWPILRDRGLVPLEVTELSADNRRGRDGAAGSRATLAVAASLLRHVAAEAIYIGIQPGDSPETDRGAHMRDLLDARSAALAAAIAASSGSGRRPVAGVVAHGIRTPGAVLGARGTAMYRPLSRPTRRRPWRPPASGCSSSR